MTRTQRFTLAATSLGLFMIYLDALIVNVALPAIQSDFKVGEAGLQWVVTAYSLGMAIAIMSSGTAADRLALDLHGQHSRRARRHGLNVALCGGVAGRTPAHVRHPRAACIYDGGRGFRVCSD